MAPTARGYHIVGFTLASTWMTNGNRSSTHDTCRLGRTIGKLCSVLFCSASRYNNSVPSTHACSVDDIDRLLIETSCRPPRGRFHRKVHLIFQSPLPLVGFILSAAQHPLRFNLFFKTPSKIN
ncbi:hypothetical protein ABZP36_023806 [Zizania latifolia]